MQTLPASEVVLQQLERMLASDTFAGAERSRTLLKFLVEHALQNQSDRLKEYTIGSEALGRGDSFDPRIDPIVRAEASRLRARIERYYATDGVADTVLITLPKGSYVPQFQTRTVPEPIPVAAATASDQPSTARRLQRVMWFVLGGITVGATVMFLNSLRPAPPVGFGGIVELGGDGYSPGSDFGNDLIVSPDGTRLVFVALGSDHVPLLMTMRLEGGRRTIRPMEDTEGARAPFFSFDSRSVGFWADAKLKMVAVDGGAAIDLADAKNFQGASWGKDGIIAVIDEKLQRVSLTSRTPQLIQDMSEDGVVPWWPQLLPGETDVLFTAVGPLGPDASNIEVFSLGSRKRTPLNIRAGFARYLKDDYLLYVNQGYLFAVPFNQRHLTVDGTGVLVLEERVAYNPIFGNAKLDIDRNGTLIYKSSPPLVASWIDRSGRTEALLTKPGAYTFPRLSPKKERLAINVIDSGVIRTEIYDLRRPAEPPTRLPTPGNMATVWHPKGFLVLGSRTGMWWMNVNDMATLHRLTRSSNVQLPLSFTADGTRLAYAEAAPTLDIWTMPVGDSDGELQAGKPEPFVQTQYYESAPAFSPDRRWLAYGWGPERKWNVYVRPFPPDGSKEINVSQTGGRIPAWLSNGRELVYRTDDHRLMSVEYHVKNGTFVAGTPREWANVRLADTGVVPNFDVFEDRILGLVPASREEAERMRTQATVIPRFLEEVHRHFSRGGK